MQDHKLQRSTMKNVILFFSSLFLFYSCLNVSTLQAGQNNTKMMDESDTAYNELKRLRKSAKTGDAEAQYKLGLYYYKGKGAQAEKESLKWFLKAAIQNHAEAQFKVYLLLTDMESAKKWLRKAADNGHQGALETTARLAGVSKTTEKEVPSKIKSSEKIGERAAAAINILIPRANEGVPTAQFDLGRLYTRGVLKLDEESIEIEKDIRKGEEWLRKAASQGYAAAQYDLGVELITGDHFPQDKTESREWLRKAASQGYAAAQYYLGVELFTGDHFPQDKTESRKWLQKAADQGHVGAAECIEINKQSNKKRQDLLREFIDIANEGDAEAQFDLGVMYSKGEDDVPQDYTEAAKWYRKAAEQGHSQAQCNLGVYYCNGTGVSQDKREAAKWFGKAAENGHEAAKKWCEHEEAIAKSDKEIAALEAERKKIIQKYAKQMSEKTTTFQPSGSEPTTQAHQARKRELMATDPTGHRYQVWLDSLYDWICPKCKEWSQVYHTYRTTHPYNATNRERIFLDEPPAYVCYKCIYKMKRGGYTGPNIIKSVHE